MGNQEAGFLLETKSFLLG